MSDKLSTQESFQERRTYPLGYIQFAYTEDGSFVRPFVKNEEFTKILDVQSGSIVNIPSKTDSTTCALKKLYRKQLPKGADVQFNDIIRILSSFNGVGASKSSVYASLGIEEPTHSQGEKTSEEKTKFVEMLNSKFVTYEDLIPLINKIKEQLSASEAEA